jgi:hypothetical protein
VVKITEIFQQARFHLFARRPFVSTSPKFSVPPLVVALEQFQEQFLFAAKVRIERTARMSRRLGNVFNTCRREAFLHKDSLRSAHQTQSRLGFTLFACESLAFHAISFGKPGPS